VIGSLYVVSTPIGNLEDITLRAIETLKNVDCIAVEDTRITRRLLKKYNISNKMIPLHLKNENYKVHDILSLMLDGSNVALVSDAGSPCISDPGYLLVNKARHNNINVFTVPGPSSLVAALSVSGLPSERFFFEGFLPKKKGRKTRIAELSALDTTIILFESPNRILKTLKDLRPVMGNRSISICKELTKINEANIFGTFDSVILKLEKDFIIKGEYVIIIAKKSYNES
tara:strand:- start:5738 stop:6424 length:687 start_codon:yes stop_codon:yes gene_type:complete